MKSEPIPAVDYAPRVCACGCGATIPLRKPGKPIRTYIYGHSRRKSPNEYEIRDAGYKTPCWIWQRSMRRAYGVGWEHGKNISAHRLMYRRHKGDIPDGLHLDHLCRNRACVNPDHLEPVTCKENIVRGLSTKLNRFVVDDIRNLVMEGTPKKTITSFYGISKSYLNMVLRRAVWK